MSIGRVSLQPHDESEKNGQKWAALWGLIWAVLSPRAGMVIHTVSGFDLGITRLKTKSLI